MTATVARRTCRMCRTELGSGRFRLDVEGEAWCEDCFSDLRAQQPPDPEAPPFRCGICGTEHAAQELRDLAGQLTCESCVALQTPSENAPPAEEAEARAVAGAAEEARQTVASLKGQLPENILSKVTCPHCWLSFEAHDVLWIAQHSELVGDPVLGPEVAARFLPSRFNAAGEALDGRDMPCQILACPRCHLIVPKALIETPPMFLSLIGAPASGKSHLLASMTWQLRRVLRERFSIVFNDADALSNLSIHRYEETLFVSGDADRLVSIRKTELQGELYDQIRLGQQIVSLPRPFLFTLRPQPKPTPKGAPNGSSTVADERLRVMCLYDNAGEHFQPGMDSTSAPGTQHMARSKVLMFLFDPTQHPGFREHCRSFSTDPQLYGSARTLRQETILTEAASRVRRYTGLSPQRKHDRPLLVVVSKADIWGKLLDANLESEPLLPDPGYPGTNLALVDVQRMNKTSAALRALLMRFTPEVVSAAEDFCKTIIYIPSSALGRGPELQQETGMLGIRPRDVRPKWAAAPILYFLAKWGGMLPATKAPARGAPKPAAISAR